MKSLTISVGQRDEVDVNEGLDEAKGGKGDGRN
jgi:hypothetical protein